MEQVATREAGWRIVFDLASIREQRGIAELLLFLLKQCLNFFYGAGLNREVICVLIVTMLAY